MVKIQESDDSFERPKKKKGRPPKVRKKGEIKTISYLSSIPEIQGQLNSQSLLHSQYSDLLNITTSPKLDLFGCLKLCKVIKVMEGDILVCQCYVVDKLIEVQVSFEGLSIASIYSRDKSVQALAEIVREKVRKMLEGKIVKMLVNGVDEKKRLLSTIYAKTLDDEIMVNEWMVNTKLAIYNVSFKKQEFPSLLAQSLLQSMKDSLSIVTIDYSQ